VAQYPAPDLTIEHIADLTAYGLDTFRPATLPAS